MCHMMTFQSVRAWVHNVSPLRLQGLDTPEPTQSVQVHTVKLAHH